METNYTISKKIISNKEINKIIDEYKILKNDLSELEKNEIKPTTIFVKNPVREYLNSLIGKDIKFYHKHKGWVNCRVVFRTDSVVFYKIKPTGETSKRYYSYPCLYKNEKMEENVIERTSYQPLENIERYDFHGCNIRDKKNIIFDRIKLKKNELNNIFNLQFNKIMFFFSNNQSKELVFRNITLEKEELNVEYSASESPYRTQRVFSFKI
jgi:hypothetical protein